jgi:hypothetical protein
VTQRRWASRSGRSIYCVSGMTPAGLRFLIAFQVTLESVIFQPLTREGKLLKSPNSTYGVALVPNPCWPFEKLWPHALRLSAW